MPENNIELRSEEVQEILSHIPNWLISWGTTVIFFTVMIILIASWFIKYPDTITAKVVLTTQTPPAKIIARNNGNIKLLVQDKQNIQQGTLLGVLENPANLKDVFSLKAMLETYSPVPSTLIKKGKQIVLADDLALGTLQNSYLTFSNSVNEYRRFYQLEFHDKQLASLQSSIFQHKKRSDQLERQKDLLKTEVALEEKNFLADSLLYTTGAGTKIQMNASKSAFVRIKRNYEAAKTNMIDNEIQIVSLQKQISELQLQKEETEDRLLNTLNESFEQLKSDYMNWEQQFLFISPIEGNITFSKYWSDNQYVTAGEEVMTIIPQSQDIFGQVEMPIVGSGKVKVGQRVNMKFDNYPSNEYGMVIGLVESISSVPRDESYTIKISLPEGLVSSYKKELEFRQEMQGNADIITKDLRLIERVFNQLRELVDKTS